MGKWRAAVQLTRRASGALIDRGVAGGLALSGVFV